MLAFPVKETTHKKLDKARFCIMLLQGHLHELFWFKVVWPNEPIWAPDKHHKIFSILVWSFRNFSCILRILTVVYVQIHSAESERETISKNSMHVWVQLYPWNSQLFCSGLTKKLFSAYSVCYTLSPRGPIEEYKRMVLEHTHGLFIT